MCMNEKLYRIVRYACDMYIEHKVPIPPPPAVTGKVVVDGVMKASKTKKMDIDVPCYEKLIRRADKQLEELKAA